MPIAADDTISEFTIPPFRLNSNIYSLVYLSSSSPSSKGRPCLLFSNFTMGDVKWIPVFLFNSSSLSYCVTHVRTNSAFL